MKEILYTPVIPSDQEWDYADKTFDAYLEAKKSEIISELAVTEKNPPVKGKSPALKARIKITGDSSKVEFLGYADPCEGLCAAVVEGVPRESDAAEDSTQVEAQHPNTIRSYVAAMLAFFGNLRVEFLSNGKVYTRKLPVFYGNREKLLSIEQHEFEELMNGNTNFLPRASLILESMTYDQNRQGNKNNPVHREISMASLSGQTAYALMQAAPSPYNITVKLNIVTRGMNDAMMLVEQVAAFFNPHYTFELVDEISGMETQARLQLDSVMFEAPEIEQFSSNEIMLDFSFTLFGNMFKPRSKEYLAEEITLNLSV